MFRKILIANRGEIACRIIATARRLGVATVAVYSDADAGALHVELADTAVPIGGASPRDSYLRGDAIIAAALNTGAQAIHPGYGFLSENPAFVAEVEAAGLVFIGPSAAAIRAMGLKDAAKKLMQDAGVPVVPGYHGANQDPEHLAGAADAIGWPVLIKAVAGGGGKGMRKVMEPRDFAAALEAAKGEAASAFGNDAVLVEKFVEKPRHIEVQIFGDGARAVHLFERDCSLQRRHQKVIEEAPAPGMTAPMRAAMGGAAVRAAEAIGYAGAGTVEFIVDASRGLRTDGFWFMEMNTRLQVEHPVTEAITGVDLVEWQLRVAAGERLPCTQEELGITGHAFEARLYAEDVPAGFLPATGKLRHVAFCEAARTDSGVRTGDEISPWYDPMIAKIITHGPGRAVALNRLAQALARTEVAGTVTNLSFLGALVRHEGFASGDVDTGLIDRDLDALSTIAPADPPALALAALVAAGLDSPGGALGGFTLWAPLRHSIALIEAGVGEHHLLLEPCGPDVVTVTLGTKALTCRHHAGGWWIDGVRTCARARRIDGQVYLFGPQPRVFDLPDPLVRDEVGQAGDGVVLAPMPGLVKTVHVAPGMRVAAGAPLAVLEAMKMEHALVAAVDGIVAELMVTEGTQVEAGAALILLEPET